jgi:TetR/AcrR family transcriptional regulator
VTGTAKRREREREQRRRAILGAARGVFREKGLAASTMEDVAQRVELSKGALYLYFPSKEELFLALALCPLELLVERFDEMRAEGVTGLARLERCLGVHAESLTEHRDVFRLGVALRQQRDAAGGGESSLAACAFRDIKRRVFRHYLEALEEGVAEGSVRPDADARLVATQIWASLMGAAVLQVEADSGRTLPDAVAPDVALAAMPDLLMAAIGARGTPAETTLAPRPRATTAPVQRAARTASVRRRGA